jgi:TnpA family transposase
MLDLFAYSQLKSFSSSEIAAMIEGLIRHDTEMRVEKKFVDSHGQSEVAFAFCHLLGSVRLMPRLKRIKYERHRPGIGSLREDRRTFSYPYSCNCPFISS